MLPKIVERPLLRHGAEAMATQILHSDTGGDAIEAGEPMIELDPRYTGRQRLECILHEALHLACPFMPEETVLKTGRYLAMVTWHMGYREHDEEDDART